MVLWIPQMMPCFWLILELSVFFMFFIVMVLMESFLLEKKN